jgi:hypothetical protein
MGTATTAVDTAADAVTITDGTAAAVTITVGAIIAAGEAFAASALVIPIARTIKRIAATRTVAPSRRGRFDDSSSVIKGVIASAGGQPSPISTAIRIRSE